MYVKKEKKNCPDIIMFCTLAHLHIKDTTWKKTKAKDKCHNRVRLVSTVHECQRPINESILPDVNVQILYVKVPLQDSCNTTTNNLQMQCEVFYGSMCRKIEFYTLYMSMMKTQLEYMLLEMDLMKCTFYQLE